jgi:D-alanyl-D-alanine carboxypeptidase
MFAAVVDYWLMTRLALRSVGVKVRYGLVVMSAVIPTVLGYLTSGVVGTGPPLAVSKTVLSWHAPGGLSVEVSQGGRVEWAGGFGWADVAGKIPATAETVYQVGSITKTFTAALVMQLVQEHKLELSERVGQFVTGLPYGHQVTIGELLDHTSGIPDYLDSKAPLQGPNCPSQSGSMTGCAGLDPSQLVHWLAAHPLQFPPGTKYSYSNSNYYLLGLVIDRVTGQAYNSYLASHLLAPLGLSHTGPCPDSMQAPSQAVGNIVGLNATLAPVGKYPMSSEFFAAGELCSTVGDLVKWSNDLASGKVVSPGTYNQMATAVRLADGVIAPNGYGLDVFSASVFGQPSVGHSGTTPGFSSLLLRLPGQDLDIAICFNTVYYVGSPIDDYLSEGIVQTILTGKPNLAQ